MRNQPKQYDVCIIGAGPAGLATLSAIREPYSVDKMTEMQWGNAATKLSRTRTGSRLEKTISICVVDPSGMWLGEWSENFSRLGIEYLRSPAIAHPDHFDMRALLAYAVAHDREDELIESGCSEIRKLFGLGQTQVGLWKLPSTSLFEDFCQDLAKKLHHDFIKASAVDISRSTDAHVEENSHIVKLSNGTWIETSSIVMALGQTGTQITPTKLQSIPTHQLISWNRMNECLQSQYESVLVVGGGLTAVQSAQYCLRRGKKVVLCSRRPLVERHFDIAECWFDKRTATKHISDFYHQSEEERLRQLREVRGGGSVPPLYMKDLRKWAQAGQLSLVSQVEPEFLCQNHEGKLMICVGQDHLEFDCVILACGVKTNCLMNPLVKKVHTNYPTAIVGGFPSISVDLEWSNSLYVVGALAGLNVGPDAANIMGARRAASIVANAIGSKTWLRQNDGALSNKFEAFSCLYEDESSSESDDE